MFVNRDWNFDEETDLKANVLPLVTSNEVIQLTCEAVPQYFANGVLAGWKIQGRYE